VPTLTRPGDSRRERVERDVLRATEELLAQGATYAGLAVERIARQAGISRTAFYFYFRDKRELLVRLTEEVAAELYREAEGWWTSEGDGAQELRAALVRVIALYREHAVLLRAVVETAAYDEPTAVAWRSIVGRFVEATRVRIEAEQAAGRVDAGLPARDTAFALAWMTERACYQALMRGDDEHLTEALTGIWLRSVYGSVGA
jgi:AcrR family transcriptional regulator